MDFSRADALLITSSGNATSINFFFSPNTSSKKFCESHKAAARILSDANIFLKQDFSLPQERGDFVVDADDKADNTTKKRENEWRRPVETGEKEEKKWQRKLKVKA